MFWKNPPKDNGLYSEELIKQQAKTLQILLALRGYGINTEDYKKLEFFFYLNDEQKSKELKHILEAKSYVVNIKGSNDPSNSILVTGMTAEIKMDESTLLKWTEDMVGFAAQFEADFDGWGASL